MRLTIATSSASGMISTCHIAFVKAVAGVQAQIETVQILFSLALQCEAELRKNRKSGKNVIVVLTVLDVVLRDGLVVRPALWAVHDSYSVYLWIVATGLATSEQKPYPEDYLCE